MDHLLLCECSVRIQSDEMDWLRLFLIHLSSTSTKLMCANWSLLIRSIRRTSLLIERSENFQSFCVSFSMLLCFNGYHTFRMRAHNYLDWNINVFVVVIYIQVIFLIVQQQIKVIRWWPNNNHLFGYVIFWLLFVG